MIGLPRAVAVSAPQTSTDGRWRSRRSRRAACGRPSSTWALSGEGSLDSWKTLESHWTTTPRRGRQVVRRSEGRTITPRGPVVGPRWPRSSTAPSRARSWPGWSPRRTCAPPRGPRPRAIPSRCRTRSRPPHPDRRNHDGRGGTFNQHRRVWNHQSADDLQRTLPRALAGASRDAAPDHESGRLFAAARSLRRVARGPWLYAVACSEELPRRRVGLVR